MTIGVFDSGIGGLSVLLQARAMMPWAKFIYYADEKNVPYGEKSEGQIQAFSREIIDFLIGRGAQAILVACNTASSVLGAEFRRQFSVPIIAMEPAVKKAIDTDKNAKILVAATAVTINGKKLKDLLAKFDGANIDLIALGELVKFAQSGEFDKALPYLQNTLGKQLANYDILVLGCTHFNYFKSEFKAIAPNLRFIDGNEGAIRQIIKKSAEFMGLSGHWGKAEFSVLTSASSAKLDEKLDGREFDAQKNTRDRLKNCATKSLEREFDALGDEFSQMDFYISGKKAELERLEFIKSCWERLRAQYQI